MSAIEKVYRLISPAFREKRMRIFRSRVCLGTGTSILDVGGWPYTWADLKESAEVTCLNMAKVPEGRTAAGVTIRAVVADGCALDYPDQSFDVGYSNSVIEHVGTFERQKAFAREIRRVGKAIWVQTPAQEFFMEPHLIAPFIHWLPRSWQRRLIRYFTVWGWLKKPTPAEVEGFLDEVRLITFAEMKELFPDCEILRERFLGMTKSYIAVRVAPPAS